MNTLEKIVAHKRQELRERTKAVPLDDLRKQAESVEVRPDFAKALRATSMGLIAEVKRRSPSAGVIREPFDPAAIARDYESHGASAVSCLMDSRYFGGGEEDFLTVRNAIGLPMLYKEFVVDPWQIIHARTAGASAVLLIAAVLSDEELIRFMDEVRSLGMRSLVEVHDRVEMQRAVDAGADCIGINNRNLRDFVTKLETTFELAAMVPPACTLVSESGIRTAEDVARLKEAGAHAVLVGESLLRQPSPGEAAARLMQFV